MTAPSDLLLLQHALLARLDALGQRQAALIDHDDPAPLLALLAERDEVLRELAPVAERVAAQRESWPAGPTPEASHLRRLLAQCADLAAAIAARDRAHAEHLSRRRDAYAAELARLDTGRDAAAAYAPASTAPTFQDRHA